MKLCESTFTASLGMQRFSIIQVLLVKLTKKNTNVLAQYHVVKSTVILEEQLLLPSIRE